jgi:hypothetical protein
MGGFTCDNMDFVSAAEIGSEHGNLSLREIANDALAALSLLLSWNFECCILHNSQETVPDYDHARLYSIYSDVLIKYRSSVDWHLSQEHRFRPPIPSQGLIEHSASFSSVKSSLSHNAIT